MTIHNKVADKRFKIYCLCSGNYLFVFMYASKSSKIVDLKLIKGLSLSAFMIMQLVKLLPQPYEYVVYLNNFFSFIKLFMSLKTLSIDVVNTFKKNLKFDEHLLKLKTVSTKKKN